MKTKRKYGWKPDLPDQRDYKFTPKFMWFLPKRVDLRAKMPPVYNQAELGSCTANGIAAAMQFLDIINSRPAYVPSRLFIYYNERYMEGTVNEDSGAMIRDGIKSVAAQGCCDENIWPYDIAKFAIQPPQPCYDAAIHDKALVYSRLSESLRAMKTTLAGGCPFVFGSTLYESFEGDDVASTGKVPMPDYSQSPIGGHCMLAVGYDDSLGSFIVRNSWGEGWGDKGYCYIPYEYLSSSFLTDDRWVITKSE